MAIRLTHIIYFILLIYPSSLLGGSILYGDYGVNFYIFFSLYIILFSIYEIIKIKNLIINYNYLLIFSFLFLMYKIYYSYHSTYLREVLLLTTTFLFFQNNARSKILNIFYIFILFSVISLLLYLLSFLIPLDLITVNSSSHKALLSRNIYDLEIIYINYGNLLLNRSDGVENFLRFSSHFLEPSFLWFFGLIFFQINKFRLIQAISLFLGAAYYGFISMLVSIFYYYKNFKSLIFIFIITILFLYFFDEIFITKSQQFEFMLDKGFFKIPEVSLFGSSKDVGMKFVGLGIYMNLFKYGLIGILLYLIWIGKIFLLKNKITEKTQLIFLIAFLIYSVKMSFYISHFYFAYILSKESIKLNYR